MKWSCSNHAVSLNAVECTHRCRRCGTANQTTSDVSWSCSGSGLSERPRNSARGDQIRHQSAPSCSMELAVTPVGTREPQRGQIGPLHSILIFVGPSPEVLLLPRFLTFAKGASSLTAVRPFGPGGGLSSGGGLAQSSRAWHAGEG